MTVSFPPDIQRALALTRASSAWERTIDITTVGARTGLLRRIEIWFHHVDERWYLSSTPAVRAWYSNLMANPSFTFHLKHGVHADLAATAALVLDPSERRRVFTAIVEDFNQPHDPARVGRKQVVEEWLAGSPLLRVDFDD